MTVAVRVEEIIISSEHDSFRASQALHDEFVIIPRADLPDFKVIDRKGQMHIDCGSDWGTWNVKHVARMKETALEYVGAWLTAEKWHAEKTAAENTRRNELSLEFGAKPAYVDRYSPLAKAIDRIIELEQAAS